MAWLYICCCNFWCRCWILVLIEDSWSGLKSDTGSVHCGLLLASHYFPFYSIISAVSWMLIGGGISYSYFKGVWLGECGRRRNDPLGSQGWSFVWWWGKDFDELSASLTLKLVVYCYCYFKGLETFLCRFLPGLSTASLAAIHAWEFAPKNWLEITAGTAIRHF